MPLCVKCKDFFPPDFMLPLEDNDQECIWCRDQVKNIQYNEKDGSTRNYSREDCIKDYKTMLAKLAETRDVKKVLEKEKERG